MAIDSHAARRKTGRLTQISCLISVIFTLAVYRGDLVFLDEACFQILQSWPQPLLDLILRLTPKQVESLIVLDSTGILVTISLGVLIALLFRRKWTMAFFYSLLVGGGTLITVILKLFIQRPRPEGVEHFNLFGLTGEVISYSYPSGHVLKNGLFFAFLIFFIQQSNLKKAPKVMLCSLLAAVPAVIGLAQVISYRHFLTDIIGAVFVTLTWFSFSLWLTFGSKSDRSCG